MTARLRRPGLATGPAQPPILAGSLYDAFNQRWPLPDSGSWA
jgi:hypothetical protein